MNEARLAETSGALFRCEQLKFILQCRTELLRQWANVAAGIAAQDNSPDAARVVNGQQLDAVARRASCVFRPEPNAAAERNQVADGRRPGALVGILRHESTLLAKLAALLPETAVAHHADELLPAQVI